MNSIELTHHWSLISAIIIGIIIIILVLTEIWVESKWFEYSDKIIITGFILFLASIGVAIVTQLLEKMC